MIRILAAFFACLVAASGQEAPPSASGLQLSIAVEKISPGIEDMPRELTVIAVTIANPGDSPRWLMVGTYANNAEHWNITANLMERDGKIVPLTRLPRISVGIGYLGPVEIDIAPHGSYRVLLDPSNFEEDTGHGGTTNLSGIIGASGDQLQIVIHCTDTFPGYSPATKLWKGDLVSGWLRI